MTAPTLAPTEQQLADLSGGDLDRPVTMINLLRFRDRAAEDSIAAGMSGAEAYHEYTQKVSALAEAFPGEVLFSGRGAGTVIGPGAESWDYALAVRYPKLGSFLAMVSDPGYREVAPWRAAALADSRLFAFRG